MSQVYMTAKLNLADGTILYPQVSLDNIVASISDPTLVSVATTTNGKVPVTELPVVTVVGDTGSNNNIPTEAAVRALADTKQNTLVAGTGTEIINGSTINAMAVNLNDVVVNNVPTNGLFLEVSGNTLSVNGSIAGATVGVPGVLAGASDGVKLVDGVAQFDPTTAPVADGETDGLIKAAGDGLLVDGGTASIDEASVESTLQDVRIDEGSTVTPVDDQVVTPGNLRGALSVGQAVDVTCYPQTNAGFRSVVINGSTSTSILGTLRTGDNVLNDFTLVGDGTAAGTSQQHYIGWTASQSAKFQKGSPGLVYLWSVDVRNAGEAASDILIAVGTTQAHSSAPASALGAEQTTYTRLWGTATCPASGQLAFNLSWFPKTNGNKCRLDVKNWRQYEVTALTQEAIDYIGQYGSLPVTDPVGPDALFRAASVYSLRDKYLVKQDMVCPFIPTIDMPDNSDLTVAAGLSYRIKYTNNNPHTITADTIPTDGYGWDTHIQMFIKGTSSINFQQPLVLMDALTPNAGHNLSVKWRNGDALVYVDDTNAGNIVISATCSNPSVAGELQYFLLQDPGSGQENYIIFAPSTDASICDAGVVTVAYNTDVLGNGTDKTDITGTLSVDSGKTIVFQDLAISGTTFGGTGTVQFINAELDDVDISAGTAYFTEVTLAEGSTVTGSADFYVPNGGIIDGSGVIDLVNTDCLHIPQATVNLSGITVQNGTGWELTTTGGTIYHQGGVFNGIAGGAYVTRTIVCNDCAFINNSAEGGTGGVYSLSSAVNTVYFNNCKFIGNKASASSVLDVRWGTISVSLYKCTATGNYTTGGDATFNLSQDTQVIDCVITGNTCSRGGFFRQTGDLNLLIEGSTITDNYTTGVGAFCWFGAGVMTVRNSTISGNMYCSDKGTVVFGGTVNCVSHLGAANGTYIARRSDGVKVVFGPDTVMVFEAESNNIFIDDNTGKADSPFTTFGDNVTFRKGNTDIMTVDACVTGLFMKTDLVYDVRITGSTVDTWRLWNGTLRNTLNAADAETVQFKNVNFTSAGRVSSQPGRIQLLSGTTVGLTGNTNAADTKIIQAPLIVVGNNASAPSGSMDIIGGTASPVTITGIGTYIDKEGDNDFRPVTSNIAISNASSSGEGSMLAALTAASTQVATTNMAQFVQFTSGGSNGVASMTANTTVSKTTVITSDYAALIGGTYEIGAGGVMTIYQDAVEDAEHPENNRVAKTVEITGGTFRPVNTVLPKGTTMVLTGSIPGWSGSVNKPVLEGGGVIDMRSYDCIFAQNQASATITGITFTDGCVFGGWWGSDTFSACRFDSCWNSPGNGLGAINFDGFGEYIAKDCTFINTPPAGKTASFGAIMIRGVSTDAYISGTTITECGNTGIGNQAGGVSMRGGKCHIASSIISGNIANTSRPGKDIKLSTSNGEALTSMYIDDSIIGDAAFRTRGGVMHVGGKTTIDRVTQDGDRGFMHISSGCTLNLRYSPESIPINPGYGVHVMEGGCTVVRNDGGSVTLSEGIYGTIAKTGVTTPLTIADGTLDAELVVPSGSTVTFTGVNIIGSTANTTGSVTGAGTLELADGSTVTSFIPADQTIGNGVLSVGTVSVSSGTCYVLNLTLSGLNTPVIAKVGTEVHVTNCVNSVTENRSFMCNTGGKLYLSSVTATRSGGQALYAYGGLVFITGCTFAASGIYSRFGKIALSGENNIYELRWTGDSDISGAIVFAPGSTTTVHHAYAATNTAKYYVGTVSDSGVIETTGTATVIVNGVTKVITGSGNTIDSMVQS